MSVACVQGPVDRLPHRSPPVTLNGHCGVIFQSIFTPNIALERSCLDLNEHGESDEKRPNGGRSKFADASISRLAEDGGRSTTVLQAIQSTRQTHCFRGINVDNE